MLLAITYYTILLASNPMLIWILYYTVAVNGIKSWNLTNIKQQHEARTVA